MYRISLVKRISFLLLALLLAVGFASCGESSDAPETTAPPAISTDEDATTEPQSGEALVAYFSATGNTKAVAEQIAALTGAALYEITPVQPYTPEDLDYSNSGSRSSLEMNDPESRPEISGELPDLSGISVLYLGYPIWHGQAPRIMSTFVEGCDFDGVTIIPFCTSGGSGIGSSAETLAEQAGGGNWLSGERFSGGADEETVSQWLKTAG